MITNEQSRYMLHSITERFHTPKTIMSSEIGIERMMLTRFLSGKLELNNDKLRLVEEYLQAKSLLD